MTTDTTTIGTDTLRRLAHVVKAADAAMNRLDMDNRTLLVFELARLTTADRRPQ